MFYFTLIGANIRLFKLKPQSADFAGSREQGRTDGLRHILLFKKKLPLIFFTKKKYHHGRPARRSPLKRHGHYDESAKPNPGASAEGVGQCRDQRVLFIYANWPRKK